MGGIGFKVAPPKTGVGAKLLGTVSTGAGEDTENRLLKGTFLVKISVIRGSHLTLTSIGEKENVKQKANHRKIVHLKAFSIFLFFFKFFNG